MDRLAHADLNELAGDSELEHLRTQSVKRTLRVRRLAQDLSGFINQTVRNQSLEKRKKVGDEILVSDNNGSLLIEIQGPSIFRLLIGDQMCGAELANRGPVLPIEQGI